MLTTVISWGGKALFWLFFLVVMVDPTNSILHVKDVVFILLVAYCMAFYKPDFSKLPYFLLLVCAVAIPYLFSVMAMTPMDDKEVLAVFKSIAPALLLLWVRNFDLVKIARGPVVICCAVTTVLFLAIISDPLIESAVWTFSMNADATIMMSERNYFGLSLYGFYLKSLISFLFVLAYYMLAMMDKSRRRFLTIVPFAFMMFAFLVSGSRSTILLPFFLFFIIAFKVYRHSKYLKYIMIPVAIFIVMAFVVVVIAAASETGEASNVVKYGHLSSYATLFTDHPWYVIFGQGPGTSFWSDGFNAMTYKTEWTYLELIRCFGVFSVVVVFVFAKPLWTFWKGRNEDTFTYCMFWAYLAYLFIAGTNPLLLSSTGMSVLMMAYSYEAQTKCSSDNVEPLKIEKDS